MIIVLWHGEASSIWYLIEEIDDENWEVLESFHSLEAAQKEMEKRNESTSR